MEENRIYKLYMISEELSERFNQQQWYKIARIKPETFLKLQTKIKARLMDNEKMFNKHFHRFHSNHIKLLNWSLLAIKNKAEISPYVFKELVSNDIKFYNEKIKQAFDEKYKKSKSNIIAPDHSKLRDLQNQIYKDYFNNLLERNRRENVDKPLNLKLYGKTVKDKSQEEQLMDGHDFYLKTFNACNGWNYIFYNYEKHMKGLSQKSKYNQKIRHGQNRSNIQYKQKNRLNLLEFQQQQTLDNECEIIPIRKLMKPRPQHNSYDELKSITRKKEIKKIVLVNHLGKPITYRVNHVKNVRA